MLRPYSEKLQEIIENVSSTLDQETLSVYAQPREVKRILFIAVTSNRGLAGAFNSSVIKEVNAQYQQNSAFEVEVLTIGKKRLMLSELLRKSMITTAIFTIL